MILFEYIQNFIDRLEERRFYQYLAITSSTIVVLIISMLIYYYKSVHSLQRQIETINEQRELIRRLVNKYEQVKKQREAVDITLTEGKGFKLGGYFNSLLSSLNLIDRRASRDEHAHTDPTSSYREIILKTKLAGLNMKELCELLNEVAQNPQVYTKELEITQSKKMPKTIDVTLAIATLEPKVVSSISTE